MHSFFKQCFGKSNEKMAICCPQGRGMLCQWVGTWLRRGAYVLFVSMCLTTLLGWTWAPDEEEIVSFLVYPHLWWPSSTWTGLPCLHEETPQRRGTSWRQSSRCRSSWYRTWWAESVRCQWSWKEEISTGSNKYLLKTYNAATTRRAVKLTLCQHSLPQTPCSCGPTLWGEDGGLDDDSKDVVKEGWWWEWQ